MATLPGVRTTILDRFYGQARTDLPGGPLIAVIAKRSNAATTAAPDFSAYYAISEQDVITQFGEDSYLHRAYYELAVSGAPRVALIPLPSDTTFNHNAATLSSATLGLSQDPFEAAFAAAESVRADIVVPWGRGSDSTDWNDVATPATLGDNLTDYFYADNSTSSSYSWAKKIADKCAEITLNSYPCVAVIGTKGMSGPEVPVAYTVSQGLAFSSLISRDSVSNGHYISVVASETKLLDAPSDWGWSNGACQYAAAMSRLPAWEATTGKAVPNTSSTRYNPTRSQAEALVTKGLVTMQLDNENRLRWVDGTTFAPTVSDFVRLSTMRIVFDAVKLVRSISQGYVGEGMSLQTRNAFETQISSALRSMQTIGALNKSDFRVQYAPSEYKAYVDLALTPAYELREIVIQVSVNF